MTAPRCWCGCVRSHRTLTLRREGFVRSFPVRRCERCGTEFLHPPPTGEELAIAYAPQYYGVGREKFVGPMAAMVRRFQMGRVRFVARFAPPSREAKRLLDIGCGNGNFLRNARRGGFSVEGTEYSETSARRASPAGDLRIHVGDSATLPLAPGHYRAVTLWHVLEHLPEPLATLQNAHRALATDGCLFVSLPNAESWQARFAGPVWFHRDPPRHLWHFGTKSLRRILSRAGFRVVYERHFSFEQNPYGWLQSMLNRLGFPADRFYEVLKRQQAVTPSVLLEGFVAAGLLPVAVALSILEASAQCGGTIAVVARKR